MEGVGEGVGSSLAPSCADVCPSLFTLLLTLLPRCPHLLPPPHSGLPDSEQLERGAVDSKKKGVIDLDPAKDYGTFVFELYNKDHKSVAVSYIIDLLN